MSLISGQDDLLTPAEVAERLRVSRSFIYTLIDEGRLEAVNVGRSQIRPRYRVKAAAVDTFLQGGRVAPKPTSDRRPYHRRSERLKRGRRLLGI